jgi:carboxyl-terminal processing protease
MFRKLKSAVPAVLFSGLAIALSASSQHEDLFNQVADLIDRHYYGFTTVNVGQVVSTARKTLSEKCSKPPECTFDSAREVMSQMLQRFSDAHTYIVSKQQLETEFAIRNGSTSKTRALGVIIDTNKSSKDLFVVDVFADSLALKYQLKPGDRIVKINGKASGEFSSVGDFLSYLREINLAGTELTLSVLRSKTELTVKIIESESAFTERAYLAQTGAGYPVLKIQGFLNSDIPRQVHALIDQLQKSKSRNLILDLRYNTGGNGSALVGALSAFTKNPALAYTSKSRTDTKIFQWSEGAVRSSEAGRTKTLVSISAPAQWTGCPPVILVNDRTASAGETFALFLQNKLGSQIIGEPTTGIANTTGTRVNLVSGDVLSLSYYRIGEKQGTWFSTKATPTTPIANDLYSIGTTADPMIVAANRIVCKK